MTFNTVGCQEIFRNRFTGTSGEPFKDYGSGKKINNLPVDKDDIALYRSVIKSDLCSFYYKALLSFSEGIVAITRKNITWATIKLYYSLYFGLRCSLLCRNVILVRANKHLYYFHLGSGATYKKPDDMTDHGGTIDAYIKLVGNSDYLCTGLLDGQNPYKWMKTCREIVNYKDAVFHDPEVNELWNNIIWEIDNFSLISLIHKYMENSATSCFSVDDAILAIPVTRIFAVAQDIKNEKVKALSEAQGKWIKEILQGNLDAEYISELII